MGEILTHSGQVEKWPEEAAAFTTPGEMAQCLLDLVDQGYRGNLSCHIVAEGDRHWQLELNADDKPTVIALLGQTVVLFFGVLESMAPEVYGARFGG